MSSAADYATLSCEQPTAELLVVRLDRPEVANALNTQMGRDVAALFGGLILDPGEVRCVILTGAGEKAFCAGGDLKERDGMSDADWRRQHAIFEHAFYAVMDCPIPVIAAVTVSSPRSTTRSGMTHSWRLMPPCAYSAFATKAPMPGGEAMRRIGFQYQG